MWSTALPAKPWRRFTHASSYSIIIISSSSSISSSIIIISISISSEVIVVVVVVVVVVTETVAPLAVVAVTQNINRHYETTRQC